MDKAESDRFQRLSLLSSQTSYCGPAFYKDEPKWVPVLPLTARKDKTRMTRTQFPLVAGYAITVNKAQGLTIKEGVVINLAGGGKRFRPASKHGLPFVVFTRSESFAMTAFKNIPPWQDFLKGRESDMLRMRLDFTAQLDAWFANIITFSRFDMAPNMHSSIQLHTIMIVIV